MANLETTNNTPFGIILWEPEFEEVTLTSTAAAVWPAGTLLGRITADGKATAYTAGASDGSEVPKFLTTSEITFTAAGDQADTVMIGGKARREDLVALGVGDITDAEADALRDFTILAVSTTQLNEFDNQ